MKKVLLALCLIFISTLAIAERKPGIMQVNQLGEVSISSSTWTAIPPVASISADRIAIMIDLDRSCTDFILITFSTSSIAPGIAISKGTAMKETDPPWTFSISPGVFLWGVVDGGAGSESLYYWEFE